METSVSIASSSGLVECHSGQGAGGHVGETDASHAQAVKLTESEKQSSQREGGQDQKTQIGVVWRKSANFQRRGAEGTLGLEDWMSGGKGVRLV